MKIAREQLKEIISEEISRVTEGLGYSRFSPWGSKKTIQKRTQLNRPGQEDEYQNRYYVLVKSPSGDHLDKVDYSGHTDDQAWDEAARLKRDGGYEPGSEFDIYEDTVKGDRYIGSVVGWGDK